MAEAVKRGLYLLLWMVHLVSQDAMEGNHRARQMGRSLSLPSPRCILPSEVTDLELRPSRSMLLVFALSWVLPATAHGWGLIVHPPGTTVQARRERVLFTSKDGEVTAYVSLDFDGVQSEIGWLLPVPSMPAVSAGNGQMFSVLGRVTEPIRDGRYMNTCAAPSSGCGKRSVKPESPGGFCHLDEDCGPSAECLPGGACLVNVWDIAPVVPFGAPTMLRADDEAALRAWLQAGGFALSVADRAALAPYRQSAAWLVALRLKGLDRGGQLAPVVLRYRSDTFAIPLAAMGNSVTSPLALRVWLFGEGRALARNFVHAVLDVPAILHGDLLYNAPLEAARQEAPLHRMFATLFAGRTGGPSFGVSVPTLDVEALAAITNVTTFVQQVNRTIGGPVVAAILRAHIAQPAELANVEPEIFYGALQEWLERWDRENPLHAPLAFDARATVDDLVQQIVEPARAANLLLVPEGHLTALGSSLVAADLPPDPVFVFNRSLPDVPRIVSYTLAEDCDNTRTYSDFGDGLVLKIHADGSDSERLAKLPAIRRLERLSDSGPPVVVVDNFPLIRSIVEDTTGCAVGTSPSTRGTLIVLLLVGIWALAMRRRRRGRYARGAGG